MRRQLLYLIPAVIFGVVAGNFLWGLITDRDPRELPSVMIDQPVPEFELGPIEGMASQDSAARMRVQQMVDAKKIAAVCGSTARWAEYFEIKEHAEMEIIFLDYASSYGATESQLLRLRDEWAQGVSNANSEILDVLDSIVEAGITKDAYFQLGEVKRLRTIIVTPSVGKCLKLRELN